MQGLVELMRIETNRPVMAHTIGFLGKSLPIPGGGLLMKVGETVLHLNQRELKTLRDAERILAQARDTVRQTYGQDEDGNAWCDFGRDEVDHVLGCGEAFMSEAADQLDGGMLIGQDFGDGTRWVGEH